ncbi:MAG TPA: MBL fold metallo-hydrolase [Bryobacteraceae bacterium]|jgi:cyclase|nr:MBL fold metallo-hydrolase [Bryobacteraceae bacterium]
MRRFLSSFGFAALLAAAFLSVRSEAQPGTVKEIVKGVWFREGEIKEMGHCNNVIIEMKDYLVIIDANFPSGAKMALADAKKVSPKPVKYVFDTHHHGDHAYGNAFWTRNGAETMGFQGVVDEMKAKEPKRWLDAAKSRKDVAELNLTTAEPPKTVFAKSPHVMDDGTRRIEFRQFGWAHTKGDGFAWLPKEGVLCTGDAATNGPYNYLGDAHVANWPKVMKGALGLKPKHVLPGHGPAGGKEIVEGEMAFMQELNAFVDAGVKAGKSPEEIAKGKLSDKVKNWVGPSFATQVKDAYLEKTKKTPRGDIAI